MHIILGGTGHIGRAAAQRLLDRGEAVTVVARDAAKAADLRDAGAAIAELDVHDSDALRETFRRGRRAFLLNPPADPAGDFDAEEHATIAAILAALDGSGLEKVVAASTYGAQAGSAIGDLGTLHALEAGLIAQAIPATINRGAYYMSNWDAQLASARDEGVIRSMFPAGLALAMVAPADIGVVVADLLLEPIDHTGLRFTEGPALYSADDAAAAFAAALGRPVRAEVIPPAQWEAAYRALGFSDASARSFAGMAGRALETDRVPPQEPIRGSTTLPDYITALVARDDS